MVDFQHVARVTAEQLAVGERLGVDLSQDTWAVARARILDVVGAAIGDQERYNEPTERQIAWAESLGIDLTGHSYRVAFATIQDALWERENRLISEMNLRPGDRVARERDVEYKGEIHTARQEFVISSIRDDGLLWFKGGGGMCGWPSSFTKVED